MKKNTLPIICAAIATLIGLWTAHDHIGGLLFELTGEETTLGQLRGLAELLGNLTRANPRTAPITPISHAGVNPFGVNTFLQQEVEPANRERQIQMIAEAGFHWIRQEFPWEDIEIHGRGDFIDRRNDPNGISAWLKYDHIVELTERYGLELIVRLGNPPAWSRAAGNEIGYLAPPDDFRDFVNFAVSVASRYRGRIRYYQIWNEPNIYPEWGNQAVDPEAYTELLCMTYRALKEVDPDIVVISGALAPTIAMDGLNLNDFIFLQRMYDAGAGDCFDVLAVQGYGLNSGPTDRRLNPMTININHHMYIRDIMIANGDAHKAIWITEADWNPVPDDLPDPNRLMYGQVTEEQRARWITRLYQRAQEEWPWVGMIALWYFKPASDQAADQAWYYFRMVEPDFTPLPVYEAMREYTSGGPIMYPGWHQENHWAIQYPLPAYNANWERVYDARATLGTCLLASGGQMPVLLTFDGARLDILISTGPNLGELTYELDNGIDGTINLRASEPTYGVRINLIEMPTSGRYQITLHIPEGACLDGFIVTNGGSLQRIAVALAGLILIIAAAFSLARIRHRATLQSHCAKTDPGLSFS